MTKYFRTTDVYIAAYIVTCGSPIVKVDREKGKYVFNFLRDEHLETLLHWYFCGKGTVGVMALKNNIKNLHILCHQEIPCKGGN